MSDVLDIITRLSYEANTSGIEKANVVLEKSINIIGEQADEIKRLEALRAQTDKTNLARIQQLTAAINKIKQETANEIKILQQKLVTQEKVNLATKRQIEVLGKLIQTQGKAGATTDKFTKSSNSATLALMNLGRVAQDAPFGFLGIANNLNPLLESFQRLREESGSNKTALQSLTGALTGAAGIGLALSVVSSLLITYGDKLFASTGATAQAEQAVKKYNDALQDAEVNARASATAEIARIEVLASIAADATQSTRNRGLAIKELKEMMPEYFGNLDREIFLQGKAADAINLATNALLARAAAAAAEKKFTAASEKRYALTIAQGNALKKVADAQDIYNKSLQGPSQVIGPFGSTYADIAKKNLETLKEEAAEVTKQLDTAIKEQARFLTDAKEFAKQAGETLFKDSTLKNPKEKKDKIKDLIVPIGKDDLEEMANDIKYGAERIDQAFIFFDNMILNRLGAVSDDDPFKRYALSVKHSLSSIEMGILEGIGPGTTDKEAEATFESIRNAHIKNETRLETLREKIRKARFKKERTEEEELQLQLNEIRLKHTEEVIQSFNTVVNAAANAANSIISIQLAQNDREIEATRTKITYATELAERGNVELLNSEKSRLDELQKKRDELANRQLALNAIIQASNQAVALSEAIGAVVSAASKGDPYTIALRVAAAVAALIAGIAAIKGAFSAGQGFKDGVIDLQGPGTTKSDSIPARLSRGESVMTAEETAEFLPALKAMRERSFHTKFIPIETFHERIPLPVTRTYNTIENMDIKSLKKEMVSVRQAIENISLNAHQSMDVNGLSQVIQTSFEAKQTAFRKR